MTAFAAGFAAVAAALCLPHTPRLGVHDPPLQTWSRWPLLLLAATVGLVGLVVLPGQALVAVLILGAAAAGVAWLGARSRARKTADATRVHVIEACEAMASELRSGQPPPVAVERGVELWPGLSPVLAASRLDADVSDALRRASALPGAGVLQEVAAAWYVCQSVGAGLADALERVVDNARCELATHRVVASELASATATARMVTILPVVLLVLSDGSGADPWGFLLRSTAGLACLGVGLSLALGGMWWIDRIVSRVHEGVL
jgi:tight adherence protein B